MRSALFWDIAPHRMEILYRRFGTTYRFHLQGSNVGKGLPLDAAYYLRRSQISSTFHPTSLSLLILSFHLRLGLPSELFPSCFLTKTLCAFLFFPIHANEPHSSDPPEFDDPDVRNRHSSVYKHNTCYSEHLFFAPVQDCILSL